MPETPADLFSYSAVIPTVHYQENTERETINV